MSSVQLSTCNIISNVMGLHATFRPHDLPGLYSRLPSFRWIVSTTAVEPYVHCYFCINPQKPGVPLLLDLPFWSSSSPPSLLLHDSYVILDNGKVLYPLPNCVLGRIWPPTYLVRPTPAAWVTKVILKDGNMNKGIHYIICNS